MKTSYERNSRSGSAFVMVLVVLLIVVGLCTVSLKNSVALLRMSHRQVLMERVHFAAESGAEEAARIINATAYMGASMKETSHTLPNGISATITITPLDSQGREFSVKSTATSDGITREVNIGRVYRATYLEYGNFYEDFAGVWWIFGHLIDGKVWTGTQPKIYGYYRNDGTKYGPIFNNVHETAASSIGGYPEFASTLQDDSNYPSYNYDDLNFWGPDFEEGYKTEVTMPALFDVDFDRTQSIAQELDVDPALIDPDTVNYASKPMGKALRLRGRTEIRFRTRNRWGENVGILQIKNRDKFGNFRWHEVYSESLDLVYVEKLDTGNVEHQGATLTIADNNNNNFTNVVKGNLTVWAEDDITIKSHIIYDNQNLEESTDKIGMISSDDIWIDRPNAGDMVLQGGFIATGATDSDSSSDERLGKMGLKDYDSGVVRGNLYLLGSRVAQKVHPGGTYSGSTFRSGFITKSTFDRRFVTDPPPFTPVLSSETRYEDWY